MPVFLFISGQEIFIILLVVLVLFGANKIPDIAKGLGKGMREFRKATDDIKREMNNYGGDVRKEFKDFDMDEDEDKSSTDLKG